jgi:glycosyltransferase 2 family protein
MAAKKKSPKTTTGNILRSPYVQIVLAVLMFIASAVLVHDREMHAVERMIFSAAYNMPDFFTPLFFVITQLGNVYVFFALAALLLYKRFYHIVVRLLAAGSIAYLLSGVGKDLIGRDRPNIFLEDVVYRDFMVRGSGFPSGHMALATALGMTLALYLPRKLQWIPVVLIIGVGFSRMQLGVHGPMDVVGGFAVGWFAVNLTKFVQIKINPRGDKIS